MCHLRRIEHTFVLKHRDAMGHAWGRVLLPQALRQGFGTDRAGASSFTMPEPVPIL